MNERLAFSAYERMSEVLVELGEQALVETLMKPLRRDESAHLGYYRTAARDLRDRLDRWQLFVARNVIAHTYSPVGAGAPRDRPAFGATIRALGDSDDARRPGPAAGRDAPLGRRTSAPALRAGQLREVHGCLG